MNVNNPSSLSHLIENIRYEMAAITESTCRAVTEIVAVCLNESRERDGLHSDDIVFIKLIPKLCNSIITRYFIERHSLMWSHQMKLFLRHDV